MFVKGRHTLMVAGLACGLAISTVACGSADEQMQSDVLDMERRIADLERSSGRYQTQLHDIEGDVLLLEDRVEAHRLSLERRGVVRMREHHELPSYRPPRQEPDHAYMTELPVERLSPEPSVDRAPDPDLEELVITNDTLADFVEEHGGVEVVNQSAARRPGGLPPVVTNDRLPVDGASARPAAPPVALSATVTSEEDSLGMYQRSLQDFNEGNYMTALRGFSDFLASGPGDDYADNAHFWIGECHYATGDYVAALSSFERVVREFPDGNKVPDSLLKIGLTYEQMDARQQASEVLATLVETYPTTDAARRATERLAELN